MLRHALLCGLAACAVATPSVAPAPTSAANDTDPRAFSRPVIPPRARDAAPEPGLCARTSRPDLRSWYVAALCEADAYEEECEGVDCLRSDARNAVECLIASEEPDATFAALASAASAVTRLYAREALVRRGAMTPRFAIEALGDGALVPYRSRGSLATAVAVEPALLWLIVNPDDVSDAALTRFFLAPQTASLLARSEHAIIGIAPDLIIDTTRSPALRRAARAWMERMAQRQGRVVPEVPTQPSRFAQQLLGAWTERHGCESEVERLRRLRFAIEKQNDEKARLRGVERRLRAQQATETGLP